MQLVGPWNLSFQFVWVDVERGCQHPDTDKAPEHNGEWKYHHTQVIEALCQPLDPLGVADDQVLVDNVPGDDAEGPERDDDWDPCEVDHAHEGH